jgi:hypothetical protein
MTVTFSADHSINQGTSGLVLKDSTLQGKAVLKHSTCELPCNQLIHVNWNVLHDIVGVVAVHCV